MDKKNDRAFKKSTHASMQSQEEDVKTTGDGYNDAFVPKTPKIDSFYNNVSNWRR